MSFANREKVLATCNSDSTISIWSLEHSFEAIHFDAKSAVRGGMTFTNDDKLLIVGTEAGIVAFSMAEIAASSSNKN